MLRFTNFCIELFQHIQKSFVLCIILIDFFGFLWIRKLSLNLLLFYDLRTCLILYLLFYFRLHSDFRLTYLTFCDLMFLNYGILINLAESCRGFFFLLLIDRLFQDLGYYSIIQVRKYITLFGLRLL